MGINALIQKLEQFTQLTDEERQLLRDVARNVRGFDRRQDIIREGDDPRPRASDAGRLVRPLQVLPNGDQPIMAFLIPGDFCDLHITLLSEMDHSIRALSPCRVALIPRQAISSILDKSDRLARALWWTILVDEAILRDWLVHMAHRPASQRLAHHVCEMLLRARAVGLTDDHSFEMPLTQDELGDTMGLSTVHINRTMQELRGHGFITTEGKRMIVNDRDRLMEFSDFDPNYLHQVNKRARLTQVEAN